MPVPESRDRYSAEAFLDVLQKKDILPGSTLAALRKQVAESKTRISARQVAKLLVDKGLLTAAMAQHLLGGETKPPAKAAPKPRQQPSRPQHRKPARNRPARRGAAAPGKGQPPKPASQKPLAAASPPAESGLASLLDEEFPSLSEGLPPPDEGQPPKPAQQKPPAAAAPPAESGLASLLDEELSSLSGGLPSLGAGPLDALMNDPSLAEAVQEPSPLDAPATPKKGLPRSSSRAGWRRRAVRRDASWPGSASGAAGVLAIIAIIVWAATRQDPNEVLQPADAAYQEGSYSEAVKQYDAFLEQYPNLASSGRARVRRGLARLRVAIAETPSESAVLETAKSCPARDRSRGRVRC